MLTGLIDRGQANQADRGGAHGDNLRLLRHAARQGQGEELECRHPQEDVARADAPLLVVDHGRAHARDALDRAVGVISRLDGEHGGDRAQHDQRGRGGTRERQAAGQRQQAKDDADNEQGDGEVDNLRM